MDAEHIIKQQIYIISHFIKNDSIGKSKILDLGCGNGDVVNAYRKRGLECYGCDFEFKPGSNVQILEERGWIKKLPIDNYQIPFEDGFFDLVVTNQVMEHVQDYDRTLSEVRRVLKNGGVALHIFPSRFRPIEPHINVPFAGIIQYYWWLKLWALLGIRSPKDDKGLKASEIADKNHRYLLNCTNYLGKKDLIKHFSKYFSGVHFCEKEYMATTRKGPFVHRISKYVPAIENIYSSLRTRVIVCIK